MIIGVPGEIKDNEFRVAIVPSGVKALVEAGHRVVIEQGAGLGSDIPDAQFGAVGAEFLASTRAVYAEAEIIVKVKEPQESEFEFLRKGQVLFTFLHLATGKKLVRALVESGVSAVAYETVETEDGALPLLRPMSEVAGRLAVQIGAQYLMKTYGGRGVLVSGVPGVQKGKVLIIGAGSVGINAAKVAVGLGAEVMVIDIDTNKFAYIDDIFSSRVKTRVSNSLNIETAARDCDILIGAVHVPGGRTPVLVSRELVGKMKTGSVVVDVAIDQGGCVETIHSTTHSDPTYVVDGVIHYGVTNMPGAVPRTSTYALTNVTLPYLLKLADLGLKGALEGDPALLKGLNVHAGKVCHSEVALAVDMDYTPAEDLL